MIHHVATLQIKQNNRDHADRYYQGATLGIHRRPFASLPPRLDMSILVFITQISISSRSKSEIHKLVNYYPVLIPILEIGTRDKQSKY